MKFFVHVYHVMRSKYVVEAGDQLAAIKAVDVRFGNHELPLECESAEEVAGYLVDVADDEGFGHTCSYQSDGVTVDGLKYYYIFYESDNGNNMDLLVHAYYPGDAFKLWQEYYEDAVEGVGFEDVNIEFKEVPTGRGAMCWGKEP